MITVRVWMPCVIRRFAVETYRYYFQFIQILWRHLINIYKCSFWDQLTRRERLAILFEKVDKVRIQKPHTLVRYSRYQWIHVYKL